MIQVSVIGSGNIAHHLLKAFGKTSEVKVVQVFARSIKSIETVLPNTEIIDNWSQLKSVDVIIIAVSDDAIEMVSQQIPLENHFVVHTSGSVCV